jgi:hypothetical protein
MENWNLLPFKSLTKIKKQKQQGLKCTIDGCDNDLTIRKGKCQDLLCDDHHKNQIIYGGIGRMDRPWTFHRTLICDICSKNIRDETIKKYPTLEEEDPVLFNRLCRNRTVADHKIRKVDGGKDCSENIQTLCLDCNADKTILNEDWRNKDA